MSVGERVNRQGDLVLVHYENQPVVYAQIQAIEPDVKRDWYQVTLLILTIPHQAVTWILRKEYIDGEPFTMGGKAMKLEKVEADISSRTPEDDQSPSGAEGSKKSPRVLAFTKRKGETHGDPH
jgi:hypothetical protein